MMHTNLPHQQADRNNVVQTGELQGLLNQLVQLWAIHGGENGSAQLMVMKDRAIEVLREVARWGWQDYRSVCEDTAETAHHLWRKCEGLVTAASELNETEENRFLCGSKQLLEANDLLIESEEEILCLMDTGIEGY